MQYLLRLAVFVAVLVSSCCVTLYRGGAHPVEVVSTPPDAQVYVDGKRAGLTPTQVTVMGTAPLVCIEQAGFEPFVTRLERRMSGWVAVDVGLGILAAYATGGLLVGGGEGGLSFPLTLLAVLVGATPATVDFASGSAWSFPSRIAAILPRALGGGRCAE